MCASCDETALRRARSRRAASADAMGPHGRGSFGSFQFRSPLSETSTMINLLKTAKAGRMMPVVNAAADARQILARVKALRETAAEGARVLLCITESGGVSQTACLWERLCAAVE